MDRHIDLRGSKLSRTLFIEVLASPISLEALRHYLAEVLRVTFPHLSSDEIEDVVMSSIVKALDYDEQKAGEVGNWVGFLRKIALNKAVDMQRSHARSRAASLENLSEEEPVFTDTSATPEEQLISKIEQAQRWELYQRAVDQGTEQERTVWFDWINGQAATTTAQNLGLQPRDVYLIRDRLRRKLRSALIRHDEA